MTAQQGRCRLFVQLPEPLLRGEAIAHLAWKPTRVTVVPRGQAEAPGCRALDQHDPMLIVGRDFRVPSQQEILFGHVGQCGSKYRSSSEIGIVVLPVS